MNQAPDQKKVDIVARRMAEALDYLNALFLPGQGVRFAIILIGSNGEHMTMGTPGLTGQDIIAAGQKTAEYEQNGGRDRMVTSQDGILPSKEKMS